jgi:RNA polymerase sigma-B factor
MIAATVLHGPRRDRGGVASAERNGRGYAHADTTALFVSWQRDEDQRARDELVRRYLPLARKLARRYAGATEPIDDLMQIACLGIVSAIDRFDPQRGVAFSSFAVPTILGELRRHFRDHGWAVHVPRRLQENALRVEIAAHELTSKSGHRPDAGQLAQSLGWGVSDVWDAIEAGAARQATSLDRPGAPDGDGDRGFDETLGQDDEKLEQADTWLSIAATMRHLSQQQREILRLRFDRDLTQSQIGKHVNISQMQVSRIIQSTLLQLRELAGSEVGAPRDGAAARLPRPVRGAR